MFLCFGNVSKGIIFCGNVWSDWREFQLLSGVFCYLVGNLLILLTFIFRIQYTFYDLLAMFGYSKKTIISLYFAFGLMVIFIIIIFLPFVQENESLEIIFASLFIVFYLSLYIVLAVLFYRKVKKLIEYKANRDGIKNDDKIRNEERSKIKEKFVDALMRCSLSVFISFISTLVCAVLTVVSIDLFGNEIAVNWSEVFTGLDALVNSFAISLLFGAKVIPLDCCYKILYKRVMQDDQDDQHSVDRVVSQEN